VDEVFPAGITFFAALYVIAFLRAVTLIQDQIVRSYRTASAAAARLRK
jgi:hypothetical protein